MTSEDGSPSSDLPNGRYSPIDQSAEYDEEKNVRNGVFPLRNGHSNSIGEGNEFQPLAKTFSITTEESDPSELDEEEEGSVGCAAFCKDLIFGKLVSVLLVFLPLAWMSVHFQWSSSCIFWFNFLAMIPLASILGDFTEELALHTNQVIGGLINATFGNAVEVVVAIQALLANEIRVVQASMLGSIFSNMLLVLGCCFLFGGMRYSEQYFNTTITTTNMALLGISSIALVLPTSFAEYNEIENAQVLAISRGAAIFLLSLYLLLLLFQLKTHTHLIADDDDDKPSVSFPGALLGMVIATALITFLSDYLVDSIDAFTEETGISRSFIGLIILPVVGNAVEHVTAVKVAMKNKMDLAMGVAIGSATQIAMFVIPVIVIAGWITDKDMTLNFPQFEVFLYVLSIIIVKMCLGNGSGNWLLGCILVATYILVAIGFWFEKVVDY
mmetsp:Transcript_28913/g.42864  ORF Transcript_28913/g.42864 Transcript_28913/m.42864 type:complete len:441 (-) Transcript_28913:219-1541(-)|eukprot:CAMPEP_0195526342 /NCGR_PEP_ID=MMETSP0794_2-20130614/27337_1 /TAXON_ID=515487 /ORGANISM="Stephanopyxis turris, Strain CCMP 815" /LENGTH=440 /DNA_ID=CAMNT_0040656999 /DNA_START=431 /DNA_END=1753 /DNA_ORIENTATION=-